jgi:hypothetical protein
LKLAEQVIREFDFEKAENEFSLAQENFIKAQEELNKFKFLVFLTSKGRSAKHLLKAGEKVTKLRSESTLNLL